MKTLPLSDRALDVLCAAANNASFPPMPPKRLRLEALPVVWCKQNNQRACVQMTPIEKRRP